MAMLVNKEAEFTLLVAGVYCDGFSVGKGGVMPPSPII